MWIEKASAHRPLLVQMFEVAFSRRICCSRVDRVSTKPRLPSASTVSPASRPGHLADELLLAGEQADIGPAEIEADADRLAFADDDVGAHLAGRADRAQRHRLGDHHDEQRALLVRARGEPGKVADPAENVGILDDDALVSPSIAPSRRSVSGSAIELGQRGVEHVAGEARHRPARPRHNAGCRPLERIALPRRVIRRAIAIASQQAVEPSYMEALATSQP